MVPAFRRIADAIEHYGRNGYRFVEVPWFVTDEAIAATAPPGRRPCKSFMGNLVASGEQSFIQLMIDGKIPDGKWQCFTPCFRDELLVDELHLNYFMKLELIDVGGDSDHVEVSKEFYKRFLPVKVIDTEIGKDIVAESGIELGSYGRRTYREFRWTYGTGIAEPRLSFAIGSKTHRYVPEE